MNLPDLPELKDRVRWARKKAGLSQEELAAKSKTTRDAIVKIELGKTMRPRNMEDLAKALGVNAAWLAFNAADLESLSKDAIKLALVWDSLPDQLKDAFSKAIHSAAE